MVGQGKVSTYGRGRLLPGCRPRRITLGAYCPRCDLFVADWELAVATAAGDVRGGSFTLNRTVHTAGD